MLTFNFNRLFKERLINKPIGFLMKHGLGPNVASNIVHKKAKTLTPAHIEKLCIAFRCTPNDLFEFTPTPGSEIPDDHPLNKLKKSDAPPLSEIIQNLSIEQLKIISETISK